PELELFVGGRDRPPIELRRLVHLAQCRPAPVLAPELEQERPDPERVVGELEGGDVLRHAAESRSPGYDSLASRTTLSLSFVTQIRRAASSGSAEVSVTSTSPPVPRNEPAGTRLPSSPVSHSQ